MRSAVPLLALAALLAGSVAPAAEPTAEDYLNFLRPVIGQWNVTVRIGDQTAETTFSARLSPSKRSIVSSSGKVLQYPAFDAIEGYDASAKKWKWTAFVSDGGHTVAYSTADAAELKGNEATFHIESLVVNADGTTDKWQSALTITTAENEWKQCFRNVRLNGEKQPDEEWVYVRPTKPQADGEKVFRTFANHAIGGTWTATIEGQQLEHTYRWLDGGRFMQLSGKGGLAPYSGIVGVDPRTGNCAWWNFNENGAVSANVMTLEADGVWLLEGRGAGPKGDIRYRGKLTRVDADTVNEEVLEFVYNSEKQKPGTNVWKRRR